MTAFADPLEDESTPDDAPSSEMGRRDGHLQNFDLLDRLGVGIARFADVELPDRGATAPRIDAQLFKDAAVAIFSDPAKRAKRRVVWNAAVLNQA